MDSAQQQLMDEAITIARRIVAGEIDPNEGCAGIGRINDKLRLPDELLAFGQLAHEQIGHEHLGMTAENCRPDILAESRKLIERHSQPHAGG